MSVNMIIYGERLAMYLDKLGIDKREFLNQLQESDPYLTYDEEEGLQVAVDNRFLTMDIYKGKTPLGYDLAKKLVYVLGADVVESIIDWNAVRQEGFNDGKIIFSPAEERLLNAIVRLGRNERRNKYAY